MKPFRHIDAKLQGWTTVVWRKIKTFFILKALHKAAEHGDPNCQYLVGLMYKNGEIRQDYILAYKWCCLAADANNVDAMFALNELQSKMTPEQITEACSLVEKYRSKGTIKEVGVN